MGMAQDTRPLENSVRICAPIKRSLQEGSGRKHKFPLRLCAFFIALSIS